MTASVAANSVRIFRCMEKSRTIDFTAMNVHVRYKTHAISEFKWPQFMRSVGGEIADESQLHEQTKAGKVGEITEPGGSNV